MIGRMVHQAFVPSKISFTGFCFFLRLFWAEASLVPNMACGWRDGRTGMESLLAPFQRLNHQTLLLSCKVSAPFMSGLCVKFLDRLFESLFQKRHVFNS